MTLQKVAGTISFNLISDCANVSHHVSKFQLNTIIKLPLALLEKKRNKNALWFFSSKASDWRRHQTFGVRASHAGPNMPVKTSRLRLQSQLLLPAGSLRLLSHVCRHVALRAHRVAAWWPEASRAARAHHADCREGSGGYH